MKVSDFRRAMRPKKYLTRDFVVYQDPKMLAARSERQDFGVGGLTKSVRSLFNRLKNELPIKGDVDVLMEAKALDKAVKGVSLNTDEIDFLMRSGIMDDATQKLVDEGISEEEAYETIIKTLTIGKPASRSEMQAGGAVKRRKKKTTAFKLGKKKGLALKKTLPKGISLSWRERDKAWILQSKFLNLTTSNPTEQEVLDKVNEFKTRKKKLFPKQMTPGMFVELRLSDKNIKLTGEKFTDFLNKEGYTTITGRKFTPEIVAFYQRSLNLTNKEIGSYRTIKEIKEIIKDSPGGNIVLKNFKNNEDYLRQYATNIIKNKNRKAIEGGFPRGNNKKEIMWKNFFTASQRGDRIIMSGTFNGKDLSDPANWPRKNGQIDWTVKDKDGVQAWKNLSFTDNQAPKKPKTFYWNADIQGDLKTQIDDTFGKGFFEKNLSAYDQQAIYRNKTITIDGKPKNLNRFIAEAMIKKDFQAIPGNEGKVPSKEYVGLKMKKYNFQEAHHPEGIANNPYKVELASRTANRELGKLESYRARGIITDAEFKKQAQTISDKFGGIRYKVGSKFVGKKGTPKTIISSIFKGIKEASPQDLTNFISSLPPGCKLDYADGGRVNYSTGSDCYNRGVEILKQARQQALQGDKTTAQKVGQSLKQFGKATGKLARFIELPLEIALEGVLIGWDTTFNAKPLDESIKDNGIVLRAIFSDFKTSGEQDRAANIAKQNPQAAKYVEAKEALDKYNKLKNTINTFKDDLASADNYQNAVVKFEEYENEIRDKIPQYTAMLTPGSPEYEAFKEARIGLARDRVEKTYGTAQDMEELMQPFEGATDVADIQKAKAEELQGNIENISSIYNFGPTFEEVKKLTLPQIYQQSGFEKNPQNDAMFEQALKKQYDENLKLFSRPQFSKGGLTRRGFLKVIGALTTLAAIAKTGIMKLTTPAAKKVLKDAPQGTPDWFAPLVEKIMKEGVDAGETMKTTTSRETVKKLEVKSPDSDGALTDTYFLYENPDTGEIRIEIDAPGLGANDGEFSLYMRPDRIDGIADDGTPIISDGEFFVTEDRAVGRMTGPDDYEIELEPLDTDLDGSASNWHKVEEFATGKTNKKDQAKQLKKKDYVETYPDEDIATRYGEYEPPYPDDD